MRSLNTATITILGGAVLFLFMFALCANGATITVDDSGGADQMTIQDAIDAASPGDTINVNAGTYIENVKVDKALTIRSTSGDYTDTVVKSSDSYDHVFEVTADNVIIDGFTITKEGDSSNDISGIFLFEGTGCAFSNNNVSGNYDGIHLNGSNGNTIEDNLVMDNYFGIHLYQSPENELSGNTAKQSFWRGISLWYSHGNILRNNQMSGSPMNLDITGWQVEYFVNDIDTTNTVDGKPVYYWVDEHDRQIPSDAGYVGVVNSQRITVKDLSITGNGDGVLFAYTNDSVIKNVNASGNSVGVWMFNSNRNLVSECTLSGNTGAGISLLFSNENIIENTVLDTNQNNGLTLSSSSSCTIRNNTIRFTTMYNSISLTNSDSNLIEHNSCSNNTGFFGGGGIELEGSSKNMISQNDLVYNSVGVILQGSSNENTVDSNFGYRNTHSGLLIKQSNNNTITSNNYTSNDNIGVFLIGASDNVLRNNILASHTEAGVSIAESSSGNLVEHNTIRSNGDYGVYVAYSNGNMISDNGATGNDYGIYLAHADLNTFQQNNASANRKGGIYVRYESEGNTFSDNIASSNNPDFGGFGFHIDRSPNTILRDNILSDNDNNFRISADTIGEYLQDIDSTNLVQEHPIYYWLHQKNRQVPADAGCVILVNCSGITVKDLDLSRDAAAVIAVNTYHSVFKNLVITATDQDGILLFSSVYNEIANCNLTFEGFGSRHGIHLIDSHWNDISETTVVNAEYAFYLDRSSNNTLTNNYGSEGYYAGFTLENSENTTLDHNTATTGKNAGFDLDHSYFNTLISNTASDNEDQGFMVTASDHNTLINNTAIRNGDEGFRLGASDRNTIHGNNASENEAGFYFSYSHDNSVTNNQVHRNQDEGFLLAHANENVFTGNILYGNVDQGFDIDDGSGNTILRNNIIWTRTGYAIRIRASGNNTIHHNNFLDNSGQANDNSDTTVWDDGTPSGGNYWSVFDEEAEGAYDNDTNGIIDSAFDITGGDLQDRYPLTEPADLFSPVADAGADQVVPQGTLVTFDGSGSTDATGVASWTWSFLFDDGEMSLTGETASFTFSLPGAYDVTLTVKDADGNFDVDIMTVIVTDDTPPVAHAGSDRMVPQGTTLLLDGSSSLDNSGIIGYIWTFDDDGPVTLLGVSPSYLFGNIGTYQITLTVEDGAGNTHADTLWVNTSDEGDIIAPTAVVSFGKQAVAGSIVSLDGSGSTDDVWIVSYTWTFDDNGPQELTGATPNYLFSNPGDFMITLTVKDAAGNSGTAVTYVFVKDAAGSGNISGVVRDTDGNPVKNASVELRWFGTTTTTDSDGRFSFSLLLPRNYTVVVTMGNVSVNRTVTVTAGNSTMIDFEIDVSGNPGTVDDDEDDGGSSGMILVLILLLLLIGIGAFLKKDMILEMVAPPEGRTVKDGSVNGGQDPGSPPTKDEEKNDPSSESTETL